MDREFLQDSNGGRESFWDGLGLEFEAKYIFDFRGAPRGGGSPPTFGHPRMGCGRRGSPRGGVNESCWGGQGGRD